MSASWHERPRGRLSMLVLLAAMTTACAGRHQERDRQVRAAVEASGGDLATRAAEARYRSARARADSETGHESMQFRLRGLSADNFADSGRGMTASMRIPMTNPWAVAREQDARDEQAAAMAASVESAAVVATAQRCAVGANHAAALLVREIHESFRSQMIAVRAWAEGWAQAETLDPVDAAQLLLEIDRRLASLEAPVTGFASDAPATVLPPLEARPPLDDSLQTIRTRLAAAHPTVQEHAAAARSYRAFARRERARAAPWFGFVEVGFETGQDIGALETRFAIDLPLAARPRMAALRHTAQAEAEELEGEAAVDDLAQDAVRAIQTVSNFFARGEALSALAERTSAADELVRHYVSEHAGDPKSVSRLLTEVLQARLAIVEARQRAALAACDLYMATGVQAASWPNR